MRLFSVIFFLSLTCLLPGIASSEAISVPVGKESTWINLETGDRRVLGRRVRRIEIDTALVREKCVRAVDGFEGFVRLRHETRDAGWMVRVECMHRVDPAIASDLERPIGTASRKALDTEAETAAGKS